MTPEFRQATRALLRRPAFSATVIATLALGIAAVTTVLSVVSALLLRPLPYAEPDRLVAIWPGHWQANREVAELRARARSYSDVSMFSPGWLMAMTGSGKPRQIDASRVGGNFFTMLGVPPLLGHVFTLPAEQPGNDHVAVLSYETWRQAFDADSGVIGRSITLDGTSYEVVAVMPRGFLLFDQAADLWTPMTMDPSAMSWAGAVGMAYGRLRPGATLASASAELGPMARAMRDEFGLPPGWSEDTRVISARESLVGNVRPVLLVLIAGVALLLLIAVANVGNLSLVRTLERRQELAVRVSLGADRRVLARLLLLESALLGAVGGAAGIGLATGGVALLRRILPADLPRVADIAVDARVVALGVLVTMVAVLLFGTIPALRASRAEAADELRGARTTTGGSRALGLMVASEVGLAVVLAVGAILMGRTLAALGAVDRGFRTDHLLTMRLEPNGTNETRTIFWRQLIGEVKAIPGVVDAGTILHLPMSGRSWHGDLEIEGRPLDPGAPPRTVSWQSVSSGYLAVAGVPLIEGRTFTDADRQGAPLVIAINKALADRWFKGEDPIGRRISAGNATARTMATIVAVVGSVRHDSLTGAPTPEVYVPFEQRVVGANALVIRTRVSPLSIVRQVESTVWALNSEVPISHVMTMDDLFSSSLDRRRLVLTLLGLFAGLGLVLSAVGTYGIVAYGVRQRQREIGVRVALGAQAGAIRRMVVGHGLRYALIGLAIGVPIAVSLGGLMRGLLFGVPATDPVSLLAAPLLLAFVAMLASWIPARRAARIDPSLILRE